MENSPIEAHHRQARVATQIAEAKRNANIDRPPEGISMWAPAEVIGCHFGVGMGLYFRMLEWLMIIFSCFTFLSFPYWIVINQSVFTDEANKDRESVGLKVFEEPSLLATTFASIPDHQLDPNNTLVYMNTELGNTWYGPMTKDDFLLWVGLLDLVGVVLAIFLVTYFTYKAAWFEHDVDKDTFDATDFAVLVTGLPPDAGFHEVGEFFEKFGRVIDVTLVLDMDRVLQACAKASQLEMRREQLAHMRDTKETPPEDAMQFQEKFNRVEEQLVQVLQDIHADMDRVIAERDQPLSGSGFLRHPSNLLKPEKWGPLPRQQHSPLYAGDAEAGHPLPMSSPEADGDVALGKAGAKALDSHTDKKFAKEAIYDTKAAFVTFNKMSEAKHCLVRTPNPGWSGWLYRHTVAPDAQKIRGCAIETVRARDPTDYIFENMCFSEVVRFWHKVGIRALYVVMLIVCALIVSGLSSRTRTDLNRTDLDFSYKDMRTNIGKAASFLPQSAPPTSTVSQLRGFYEEAMQEAASSATTPAFSSDLASQANFTDYCQLALPEVCAEHYRQSLGGAQQVELEMTFGKHLQWGKNFDELVYERPVLNSLNELAEETDPRSAEGTDVGLSACLACYCLGLSKVEETQQKPGDWLLVTRQHCGTYIVGDEGEGTDAAISVVIAVLNIVLKLFVQFLAAAEKQWTISAMTIFPFINICIELIVKGVQRMMVLLKKVATQNDFNSAWDHLQFLLQWCCKHISKSRSLCPFFLQQRVADVLLNISVALLFCSGMPLCAATVVLVFGVATIMDRWAITNLMSVTRYGSELPRLILGLLPWMVFLHCGFGLWMHSYFMMENWDAAATSVFVQTGQDELDRGIPPERAFGVNIDERNVNMRISQPNSFGLLILAFIMFLWLLFRHVVQPLYPLVKAWIAGKVLESKGLEQSLKDEGMVLPPDVEDDHITFAKVLAERKLASLPTYQLPFLPRYAAAFSGDLYADVWTRMLGPCRYTRLLPVRVEIPLTVYRVEVKTSDIWGAGTDSPVLIQILATGSGNRRNTQEGQNQDQPVEIRVNWRVSEKLILYAKDAPELFDNFKDPFHAEYGPVLSSYLASKASPKGPVD
ncbi:hypothetical protein DUNSADRAFT_10894 [Dunaliella salina]|uniref:PLAT domain-containing protein n=1 Tax=Dunaliella salina TaxID=3046 RepID=A0ABQ7H4P7_DUNSA|nr:hypothetical protein DUNSADRAFT_10894 [Dunaliella salina]|eukprot:KAF5841831.1 hypothetical protein DUNSADRAFT_10894 [Dunaliella salina]